MDTLTTENSTGTARRGQLRQSLAGGVGAFVEQFDFNLYGVFAVFFAQQFFPSDDRLTSLLKAFLLYALTFFLRPVGGALIGAFVDRRGRRAGLLLTVTMMTAGSLLIAVTPNHAAIGSLAPLLLVLARSLQGLAAGGEVGTAMPFLAENAPPKRRGLWSSAHGIATGLSLLLVSALSTILVRTLSDEQMTSYGWRIGFGVSALLGVVAFVIRRDVGETPARKTERNTFRTLILTQWRSVLRVIGISVAPLTFFYLWMSYLPTFTEVFGGLPAKETRPWSVVGLIVFTAVVPLSGFLSDRLGRRPMLIVFVVGCLVLVPFTVLVLSHRPSLAAYAVLQCLGAVFTALEMGVKAAVVCEQFGGSVRGTGVGLAYSIAAALFGGSASYIATWLTGDGHPSYLIGYLILAGLISLAVYLRMPETRGRDLAVG